MLHAASTALVLVDVQEKLYPAMAEREALLDQVRRLLGGAQALSLPVVVSEQIPDKLGPTLAELQPLLTGAPVVAKATFAATGEAAFVRAVAATGRRQVLVAGIETQVCVYQTIIGLQALGYEVQVVADAVSSRTVRNRDLALARLAQEGIRWTTVEMALFELLQVAGTPAFRAMLKVVK